MKLKKILRMAFVGVVAVASLTGCTHRLGNMTVVSTNNIDGLNTKVSTEDRVTGKSCLHTLVIIPFGDFENRLQIATDNAIDNGRAKGIVGDTIVNAKIDVTDWMLPLIYGQKCLNVSGDLVQLSDSMK